jgi:hypothetical protein
VKVTAQSEPQAAIEGSAGQFEPLELALVDAHNGGDSVPVGAQLR